MDSNREITKAYADGYGTGYKAALIQVEKLIRDTVPSSIIYESDELLNVLNELRIKGGQQ